VCPTIQKEQQKLEVGGSVYKEELQQVSLKESNAIQLEKFARVALSISDRTEEEIGKRIKLSIENGLLKVEEIKQLNQDYEKLCSGCGVEETRLHNLMEKLGYAGVDYYKFISHLKTYDRAMGEKFEKEVKIFEGVENSWLSIKKQKGYYYNRSLFSKQLYVRDPVFQEIMDLKNARIFLDLFAGTGGEGIAAAEDYPALKVVIIDGNPRNLASAIGLLSKKPEHVTRRVRIIHSWISPDTGGIPLPDHSVDRIALIHNAMHAVPLPLQYYIESEILRISKDNAIVFADGSDFVPLERVIEEHNLYEKLGILRVERIEEGKQISPSLRDDLGDNAPAYFYRIKLMNV